MTLRFTLESGGQGIGLDLMEDLGMELGILESS